MAPLRRYIRITPHTTLQALIFLEEPSVLHTWLIHPTHPALPRIIASLKDLILPKLEEERERELKSKSRKNRAVKDVVVGSDFEVSVFFRDGAIKHAVMRRRSELVRPKTQGGLRSNSSKMVLGNEALSVGEHVEQVPENGGLENLRIENDEDDDAVDLNALPLADPEALVASSSGAESEMMQQRDIGYSLPSTRSGRKTRTKNATREYSRHEDTDEPSESDDNYQATKAPKRVQSISRGGARGNKKKKKKEEIEPITIESGSESEREIGGVDTIKQDKKPLFTTSYEGYAIYGKILYLIVRKLDVTPTEPGNLDNSTTVVSRDIPIAPDMDATGVTEDAIMDGWMYMSQVIREEPD